MKVIALLCLFLFAHTTFGSEFNSLCIGTNGLDPSHLKMKCVFNKDAVVMDKMFKKQKAKTTLLYGWVSYKEVYEEVEKLTKQSTPESTSFIFFSMHGRNSNEDYLMPTYDGNVSGTRIVNIVSKAKGRVIIAVDTCEAGTILKCGDVSNIVLFGSSKEAEYARWIKNLPRRQPCGYLTRPLHKIFSKTLSPSNDEIVSEISQTNVPITQTLWHHLPKSSDLSSLKEN